MMGLQEVASSPRILQLGIWFSQHTPERIGHRLTWWAAKAIGQIKPAVYEIVQANLGQVLGPSADRQTLEQTAHQVFHTFLRSQYDLFRALRLPRERLSTLVELSEEAQALVRSLRSRPGGTVMVFPHVGNFDLGGLAVASYLPDPQVLTLPNPSPSFQLVNKFRQRTGAEVTPLSSEALRKAIKRLRGGGLVSIAGDRPVSDMDEPVSFFGQPARVPSGHVRLALKTGAVVVVLCCFLSPETQKYVVHLEPPLEMVHTGDRDEEVQVNMRRVLDVLETVIRRWAGQWQMFVPVWPDITVG